MAFYCKISYSTAFFPATFTIVGVVFLVTLIFSMLFFNFRCNIPHFRLLKGKSGTIKQVIMTKKKKKDGGWRLTPKSCLSIALNETNISAIVTTTVQWWSSSLKMPKTM